VDAVIFQLLVFYRSFFLYALSNVNVFILTEFRLSMGIYV